MLQLPREVGRHPEDNEPILANFGRFGPYVQHLKTYANLADPNDVFDIGLNRAVALIAEKRAGGGMRRGQAAPLREVGQHPDGEPIRLYAGRFGPYLKHGPVNANIPKGADPASITLEQAIEIVDARALAAPAKGKGRKKASAKKPTGDKTSTTKKTSAKAGAAKGEKPAKTTAKAKAPAKTKPVAKTTAKTTTARAAAKTTPKPAPKTSKAKQAKAPAEET